jgi:hypothetical protein
MAVAHPTRVDRTLVVIVLAVAALAWWPGLATFAEQQIDAGMKRALLSFGAARGLNAILSVLQGTEVAAQPLGVGLTLSLGQVLEPVNRIVEQFSTVMLFTSVAFGAEKVLVAIGSWWPVTALLSAVAIPWSWLVWSGREPRRWLSDLLVILLLLRFAVPVAVVGSDYLFRQFLSEEYVTSLQALEEVRGQVQRAAPSDAQQLAAKNWMDRLKDVAFAPVTEVKQRYESVRAAAEHVVERIVRLMVVFVLQTVVMPLLLLWTLVRAARFAVTPRVNSFPAAALLDGR